MAGKTAGKGGKKGADRRKIRWTGKEDRVALWTLRAVNHETLCRRFCSSGHGRFSEVWLAAGLDVEAMDALEEPSRVERAVTRRLSTLERRDRGRGGLPCGDDTPRGQALAAVERNVDWLADSLKLSPTEHSVLSLAAVAYVEPGMNSCIRAYGDLGRVGVRGLGEIVAVILGLPAGEVARALRPESLLIRAGLVDVNYSIYADDIHLSLTDPLQGALANEAADSHELEARLLQAAPPPVVEIADFPHLRGELDTVVRHLRSAVERQHSGVNVLLWGAPGVGKTQLSRALTTGVSARAFGVPDTDREGAPTSRSGRLSAYCLCQQLLQHRRGVLVLFDELEDVFLDAIHQLSEQSGGRQKAFVNRLLESNPVPTVWMGNRVDQLDPAVVRRFDLVVEVKAPPRSVRQRLLRRALVDVPVRGEWLDLVADDDRVAPADITRAAAVLEGIAPADPRAAEEAFERIVDGSLHARGFPRRPPRPRGQGDFDYGLVNTSCDLGIATQGLARVQGGSVCLHGPPGVGKTLWTRELARTLDRPLLVRRASDLLGPFVGMTEMAIAGMFEQARADDAVLLLDEADSFLRDRRLARQSWQITQVNELLVGIESFDGVFVAATNLIDDLDQAVFRRFEVKVRFDPLTGDQRWRMFERIVRELGVQPGAGELRRLRPEIDALRGLTPGDFAAVRRGAEILGEPDAGGLVAGLAEELGYRRPVRRRTGFRG